MQDQEKPTSPALPELTTRIQAVNKMTACYIKAVNDILRQMEPFETAKLPVFAITKAEEQVFFKYGLVFIGKNHEKIFCIGGYPVGTHIKK